MTYRDAYHRLRALSANDAATQSVGEGIDMHRCRFTSSCWPVLPGATSYRCDEHDAAFVAQSASVARSAAHLYPDQVRYGDVDIVENRAFPYMVFMPPSQHGRASSVVLLFHGLNERSWDKYLPWAHTLAARTGKAVLLFPIAFHMNRAPASWGEARAMAAVAAARRAQSPALLNSSYANAAISARLEEAPQRFFWSGLQTFTDVSALLAGIHDGTHPLIAPGADVDVFAYSIGGFLAEILMMADPRGFFARSRLFLFCAGPTLDRMAPNSKFILDSDATIALYSFYTERLEAELSLDARIAHYFSDAHPVGPVFRMLLSHRKDRSRREQRLRRLAPRIRALALAQDDVIPPAEVRNTLLGDDRDIPCDIDVLDFPYPYTHISPFPHSGAPEAMVDDAFDAVFQRAARFFA